MMRFSTVVVTLFALSPSWHSATTVTQRSVLELEKRIEDRNNKRGLDKGELEEDVASDDPEHEESTREPDLDASDGIDVATIERTSLFSEPTDPSEQITLIPKGATITVLGHGSQSRVEAMYLDFRGYVPNASLDRSDAEIAAALDEIIATSPRKDPR